MNLRQALLSFYPLSSERHLELETIFCYVPAKLGLPAEVQR